jgi:anti-sigma factor RsiW
MKRRSDPDSLRGQSSMPPTDLELMLWMDGELSAERAPQVEAYVASDARARAVVDSLRLGTDLLLGEAEHRSNAQEPSAIVDDVMDSVEAAASRRWTAPVRRAPAWRTPALAASGFALALAASFFLVMRSVDRSKLGQSESTVSLTAPQVEQVDDSASDGAAIAVVDFGVRPGAVLYVPSEGKSATAIVWLTEDAPSTGGDTQ